MRVGFLGLGLMGNHLATNVQKEGHDLVVHDLRPEAARPHLSAGAMWADSPKKVAEAREVVFTSLLKSPGDRGLSMGDVVIIDGVALGNSVVDHMSTSTNA